MGLGVYILTTLLFSSLVQVKAGSGLQSSTPTTTTPLQSPRLDDLNVWCYDCADSGDAWPACREGWGLAEVQRKLRDMGSTVERLLSGPQGARICWRTAPYCVIQSVHDLRQNSFVPGSAAGNNPRAVYARTCTDLNRVTGTFQDGTNFNLDGAPYNPGNKASNRTVCHVENGTLFVCVTFCQTDFCNGPQLPTREATEDVADASRLVNAPGGRDGSLVNRAVTKNSATVTTFCLAILCVIASLSAHYGPHRDYYLL